MARIEGLEEVLSDLNFAADELDNAMDEIAEDVSLEILDKAIDNVSGANTPFKTGGLPYPVRVITGDLKRSLRAERVSHAVFRILADATIANYAIWVHEGTSKMEARPFLDDAKDKVLNDGTHIKIASEIVEDILNKR